MTLSSLIAAKVQVDMGQSSSSAPDFIKNKPTLGTAAAAATSDFDAAGAATAAQSAAAMDATTKASTAQSTAISTASSDATSKANAAQAAAIQRGNHSGTQTADTITDGTTNKVYSAAEKTKLAAIAAGATAVVADTGWTANGTSGDKTVAIQAYINGVTGTMVTALNVTSGGLGTALSALADQVAALTKKLAALETVLATAKLPNA